MHRSKCPIRDGDALFINFTACKLIPKMKHHFFGRRAVLEGDVQPLGRQELYSDVLKFAFLDRQIVHVSKLVLTL